MLEPVQGEGGFIPMPTDFLVRLREICDRHGILYVDDEVQSGVGRTGPVWAIEHAGVEPDLLLSGKSLGGGLPLAAVTGRAEVMDAVEPGGLGGTFGGNPVACAAGIAVLDEVATDALPRPRRGDRRAAACAPRRDRRAPARRSARCEASGRCSRWSSSATRETKEPAPELAVATTTGARERGPDPALLRPVRERRPHPRPARRVGRGARPRPRPPGGVACRRLPRRVARTSR